MLIAKHDIEELGEVEEGKPYGRIDSKTIQVKTGVSDSQTDSSKSDDGEGAV